VLEMIMRGTSQHCHPGSAGVSPASPKTARLLERAELAGETPALPGWQYRDAPIMSQ
jgi:hypothetical protein